MLLGITVARCLHDCHGSAMAIVAMAMVLCIVLKEEGQDVRWRQNLRGFCPQKTFPGVRKEVPKQVNIF